jgi:two-component system chemotaxis response regulator CheY
MRTLIAEDDSTNRMLLEAYLAPYGECDSALNGKEAVEAFRAARREGRAYDLICMDIMMPEMDGQAALRQIRALEKAAGVAPDAGVKVIMTTALDGIEHVSAAFQALASGYVLKPVSGPKLLRQLRSLGLIP